MGSCLSTKSSCASSTRVGHPEPQAKPKSDAQLESETKKAEETVVRKEIFIIKHRNSHEVERQKLDEEKDDAEEVVENVKSGSFGNGGLRNGSGGGGATKRTSSCTKEEVDAILIQCGRLSRSSSTGKSALSSENGRRTYSGSKRSYDFDNENGKSEENNGDDEERENHRRERHRQSQGRRRTPSRERDKDQAAQRSGSRERYGSGGGRRVSRSPGRRSESPSTSAHSNGANSNANSCGANANSRPEKMVSVPATVSSLPTDKSNNGGEAVTLAGVKRIKVKRNVGGDVGAGARTAASPRARSPAGVRASNENLQQPMSLSRSNSRKAEHSPFRRNPLAEIDTNIMPQGPTQKPNADNIIAREAENRINSSKLDNVSIYNGGQQLAAEETKGPFEAPGRVLKVISSGPENVKPHRVTRSRSRLSRDLDISPEVPTNPNVSSYTALLLEDIQNFHQKTNPPAEFSLPPCVTKAHSILEAVADLNSSTSSNHSSTFCVGRQRNPITEQMSKIYDSKYTSGKTETGVGDAMLESETLANADLVEPSFHKCVTVRRGTAGGEDLEEQESSGSNSLVGNQKQWVSASCWEPNSAESTDHWTSSSSRSVSRQNEVSPVGFQRHAASEPGEGERRVSAQKKDSKQKNGNRRCRRGTQGPHTVAVANAST